MASNITFKNMDIESVRAELCERVKKPEHMLGRSLLQPFCNTNSGSRKLMHSTHQEQRLALLNPEIPMIQTGYENEYGKYASSFITANADYVVLNKIEKFPEIPGKHYFLIIQDTKTGNLDVIERKEYEHISEAYGYLKDNTYIDRLKPIKDNDNIERSNIINKGDRIQTSKANDMYNNRQDGVNLLTAYISTMENTEDSVIISESAAKKLRSPLIREVTIIVNDNDILLDLYGKNGEYKSFPDIGEDIENGMLAAVRRENKEETLFTHSYERLKDIMMPDDKFIVSGKVVDIDIYCNNPDTINKSVYNTQIRKYNNNRKRYLKDIIDTVNTAKSLTEGIELSYRLEEIVHEGMNELNGIQFIDERPFAGTKLKVTVIEYNEIKVGDKLSDRYGGKGVVSYIKPDNEMPIISDTREPVDIIYNACTCVGRLNPGQMFETSLNFISKRFIDFVMLNVLDIDQSIELIREYFNLLNLGMGDFLDELLTSDDFSKDLYLKSIFENNGIVLSMEPISDSIDIDILFDIYKEFRWVKQYQMITPIKDSNGNIRYVYSRRPMVIGNKYIYRLKQYGKDKFSATSSSATNIRNNNTRTKATKQYKNPYNKTPIRVGEMETFNLNHIGNEIAVIMMMIHSSSPLARRSVQTLYNGDPFDVNIKIGGKARNRNAEIINTRLKTCGYRLVYEKVKKRQESVITRIHKDVIKRMESPINKIVRPVTKIVSPIEKIEKV